LFNATSAIFSYITFVFTFSNGIGGVMVSMVASSVVDHGFESRSGKTKDNKKIICCFSDKHAALRRKNKEWFTLNQDNVSDAVRESKNKSNVGKIVNIAYKECEIILPCNRPPPTTQNPWASNW
jgi:hypothetical protein